MFEWLKRLVARRELAELEELRREVLMLAFARGADRHDDWIKKFAAESRAASHEKVGSWRWDAPHTGVDPETVRYNPDRASCDQAERGIDYRFLGMTGEEEA
ncbi:hypothetical protein WM08_15095 [Burkholderia ubonensis]|uniref:hypothetical protein n=1 Tax=Burkholderia ubonensis TaxID=101571 RepID=UPI00075D111C|nr:hypothetical protein [Burkholderia ubonensis]KVP76913.1 hypothetical protein WJ94_15995 [Burkholderia ubonensis]KWI90182.1 hypothetical protein WM08_15095 [Burkholderia ubonensis]